MFSLCALVGDLISGLVGKVCVLIVCPCWQSDFRFCRQGVCVLVVCPCWQPDSGSCRQGVCILVVCPCWIPILVLYTGFPNFFNVFLGGFAFSASMVLSSVVGARAFHI